MQKLAFAMQLHPGQEDEYRRLYLTAEGREAVQGGEADIEWRMTAPKAESSTRGGSKTSEPLSARQSSIHSIRRRE